MDLIPREINTKQKINCFRYIQPMGFQSLGPIGIDHSSPAASFPQFLECGGEWRPARRRGGAAAISICFVSGGSDMDCRNTKRGAGAVACPPDDSLVEIFSRLHAKPLFRFKSVSKGWCGLIADRLRCRKFPQTLEGFFAGGKVENYGGFIDLSGRPVPLVDPSFAFLTKVPEIEKIILLDSCNGLVLFGHRLVSDRYDSLGYIVCNPATEEWVSVPSSPLKWDGNDINDEYKLYDSPDTYLMFDPAISPHFQLVQLLLGLVHGDDLYEVHIFSSLTGAWRQELEDVLELTWGLTSVGTGAFAGCLFNGMLHIRAHRFGITKENLTMILAVGGEGRPFRTLQWPRKDCGFLVFVGQSRGTYIA